MPAHFKFLFLVLVLHGAFDVINPAAEQILLEVLDGVNDLIRRLLELHHATEVGQESLGHLQVVLDF